MEISRKQVNKQIKKLKKIIKRIFDYDHNSPKLANTFFIFLVAISLLYAFLIFAMAEKVKNECRTESADNAPTKFERKIGSMVKGRPIESMIPYIAQRDRKVATYMIAIAKKESDWGKFSPKKDGKECWNFWGYRGTYNQTDSGYSCFRSPRHAVHAVGDRIESLIKEENIDSPDKMAVWKCGYDCSWDNPKQVEKWIDDVGYYYKRVYYE